LSPPLTSSKLKTRNLCYHKDDHAMHPIYGCPENFGDSLTMPTATIQFIVKDREDTCRLEVSGSYGLA